MAMSLGLGLGLPFGGSAGPAAPVVLNAVRMHMDYSLKWLAGTMTSTRQGFASIWLRGSGGSVANTSTTGNLFNKYIFGNHGTGTDAEHDEGANFTFDSTGIRLNLNTAAKSPMDAALSYPAMTNAGWDHWLWVWDTNWISGQKRTALSKNGVQQSVSISGDVVNASDVALLSADFWLNMIFTAYQNPSVFDVAQFVFDNSDTSAWLTGNGTFAPNVISKFYKSGPVASNATGSNFTPAATQPLICLDGPKATWGTNKGSLANPTVVGTAQRAAPYDYMFGPGATPDRAYESWTNYRFNPDVGTFPTEANGATGWSNFINYGNPIVAGDLMILIIHLASSAAPTASRNIALTNGWTIAQQLNAQTVGNSGDIAIAYKIAVAGDATAVNGDWAPAIKPVLTWTTRGGTFNSWAYTMSVWKNCSTIATAISQIRGLTTGFPSVATPVTAPSGKSTLVTGVSAYNWPAEGSATVPTGENLLWYPPQASGPGVALAWEPINAAGSVGAKAWGDTVNGNSDSFALQMILQ